MKTSMTSGNTSRRFYGCARYGVDATCGYFEWVDSPMCHSGREVLPKMVAKMNCLEKKLLGLLQQALRHIQLPQQTGFHLLPLVSLQLSAEASFTSSSILRGAIVALMQITLYLVQETNESSYAVELNGDWRCWFTAFQINGN
ncbi:hypothetical protein LOK49_LG06G02165 [Camellia lanceoleosa]|uniref:Uncharacterized protein n=1 Tax=Camellia lanceoleosa TaxID=1840588 RepID=A0ACC0HBA3_9ERIC|nr:hypothetical protein LOK49_LG06G02165 [Camellia lanceoleosa]